MCTLSNTVHFLRTKELLKIESMDAEIENVVTAF